MGVGEANVSEPVPCPNCQALLRLPPGQSTVRCPSCQMVLAVETDEGEVPPAPPVPPPPAPVTAVPLPFGRPKPATPVPPPPVARPATVRQAPPKRARLAPEDPYAAPTPERDESEVDDERRRKIRDQLREAEEKERQAQIEFEELSEECRYARTGMQSMAYGAVASCIAAVCYFLFTVTTLTSITFFPLLWIAAGMLVCHWIATLAGFGYCSAGPRGMRPMAIGGILVTVLQIGLAIGTALVLLARISADAVSYQSGVTKSYVSENLLLSNVFNNLSTVIDMPVYVLAGALSDLGILILPLIGGTLEFAKLSILGLITNRYASEGKDPDLAHQAMRFVYRIFGLVLIGAILKCSIWGMVKFTGGEPLLLAWFSIPIVMVTNGYYMWWAFAWYAQYQVMIDTVEVMMPDRFLDRRDRLDMV